MIDKNFGKRLKIKRKAAGYSCLEVAEKCFVNEGYIRQIEAGTIPSIQLLIQLCNILNTSPNYLLGYVTISDSEEEVLVKKILRLTPESVTLVEFLLDKYLEFIELNNQ